MPYDDRWLTEILARGQVRLVGDSAPAEPPAVSERAFQAAVLRVARGCGWAAMHVHDSRRSPAGFPDLVLVRPPSDTQPGTALFWELKSAEGILMLQQAHWLRLLSAVTHVEAGVWRPEDMPALIERLRG